MPVGAMHRSSDSGRKQEVGIYRVRIVAQVRHQKTGKIHASLLVSFPVGVNPAATASRHDTARHHDVTVFDRGRGQSRKFRKPQAPKNQREEHQPIATLQLLRDFLHVRRTKGVRNRTRCGWQFYEVNRGFRHEVFHLCEVVHLAENRERLSYLVVRAGCGLNHPLLNITVSEVTYRGIAERGNKISLNQPGVILGGLGCDRVESQPVTGVIRKKGGGSSHKKSPFIRKRKNSARLRGRESRKRHEEDAGSPGASDGEQNQGVTVGNEVKDKEGASAPLCTPPLWAR
ncbi:hypothetical protein HMPREF2787_08770 [Corynebacterium sp. HMSC061H03]|nr:hypothetical protein HMPREF2787_08770 [Corynebacterium sp. HMSC061H03]